MFYSRVLPAGALLALLFVTGMASASPPLTAPKVVDISEVSGDIDPARMKVADVSAVVVRASHGAERDGRVVENVAQLRAAGIPVAALYHDYEAGVGWRAQYATLAQVMAETGVRRAAVWLNGADAGSATGARSFMAALRRTFPLPAGYKHLIFTNALAWQALGSPAWGKRYELWVGDESGAVEPAVPAPWRTWRLWQYTAEGDGPDNGVSSTYVGISRFNGSSAQFDGWLTLARARSDGR